MSDILKEAIADAKAVRETALQNAKAALEEAFAPHLKNMLSAKLSEEDVEEGMHDDEADEEMGDDHEDEAEETWHEEAEPEDDDAEVEEAIHDDEEEEGMHKDEAMHDDEEEEGVYEEDEDEELDLEAIIKELEAEVNEAEGEEDEEGEEIDENDVSSDIGNGDNKQPGKANQSSNIGKAKNESADESEVNEEEEAEEEEVAEVTESAEAVNGIKAELAEYKEAVEFLQDKLHEVNILNAKLLFTNKLFKEYALDKDQKMKVVETMDRAQSTREIKLVYSTLAEAFSQSDKITRKQTVKESASKPVGSTAPKKIISEENEVANRFKKLAGII